MFRISINAIENIISNYSSLDRCLAENIDRLTVAVGQCKKLEYEDGCKRLRKILDNMLEDRRALYECATGLERIKKIYMKCEKRAIEEVEGTCPKETREIAWIDFIFSEETTELINKIRI